MIKFIILAMLLLLFIVCFTFFYKDTDFCNECIHKDYCTIKAETPNITYCDEFEEEDYEY